MGCSIKVEGNVAIIDGVKGFTGATVNAPDLRAGAALVIAGLAAEGYTVVDEIGYIQRGYENFEEKLRGLGAVIEKVDSEKEAQKFRLKVADISLDRRGRIGYHINRKQRMQNCLDTRYK